MGRRIEPTISDRFTFRNFQPPRDLTAAIDAQLSALSNLIPDGSTINGVLERMGIGYRCKLQAISIHGPIHTEVLANDPHSALLRLEKRLGESVLHERP